MEQNKYALIMIPFVWLDTYNSGVNIQHVQDKLNLYLKNCSVACVSARKNNPEIVDVALVTNIDVPSYYQEIFVRNNIIVYKADFDRFNFGRDYRWSLAFYKLCALSHVSEMHSYQYYCYLDSDVYVQDSFEDVWKECENHIMLYDFNHGYQAKAYRTFVQETDEFLKTYSPGNKQITHWGGEFYAANSLNTKKYLDECLKVYNTMREMEFVTTRGDEFIVSVAALQLGGLVKNAGSYIFRFWTGSYHLINTRYEFDPLLVLHMPDQKEKGIIKIFEQYISRNRPLPCNLKIHKILGMRPLIPESFRVRSFIINLKHNLFSFHR